MKILDWNLSTGAERCAALRRPALEDAADISAVAHDIIERVRRDGDAALLALTQQFDGVRLESLAVTEQEFAAAEIEVTAQQHAAIERAIDHVGRFHAAQASPPLRLAWHRPERATGQSRRPSHSWNN